MRASLLLVIAGLKKAGTISARTIVACGITLPLLSGHLFAVSAKEAPKTAPAASTVSAAYQGLPLQFEQNQGQIPAAVKFLSRGQGYDILLQSKTATLVLHRPDDNIAAGKKAAQPAKAPQHETTELVRMELLGANDKAAMRAEKALPGYVNYMIGKDPAKWRTGVPTFAQARVAGVYPGIDLVYYGTQRQLEYDFVVAPGADSSDIHLALDGVKPVLSSDGDLILQAGSTARSQDMRFRKPVLYQQVNGLRRSVDGSFTVAANGQVGFHVGAYDHSRELVIDPIVSYASFFGGPAEDEINGSAVNAAGQLYAVGQTFSTTLPETAGELQPTSIPNTVNGGNGHDGFVTKFSADGKSVLWTTFLGGSLDTFAYAVAVGSNDNAYVAGQTASTGSSYYQSGATYQITDFPVTGNAAQYLACPVGANAQGAIGYPPYTQEVSGNCTTAFIAELSSDGKSLLYSTYLGGANGDSARAIAVDASGNFYVAGYTYSTLFESVAPSTNNLGDDPTWFLLDTAHSVPGGSDFPTTATAYESATAVQQNTAVEDGSGDYSGGQGTTFPVAFLTAFNPSGAITYSTTIGGPYLGNAGNGSSFQGADTVAVGQNGVVYVGGTTSSFTFPTTAGTFSNVCAAINPNSSPQICNINGWVAAFDTTKSGAASKLFATYMTGLSAGKDYNGNNLSPTSHVNAMTTDSAGNVVVVGDVNANDMLTSSGVLQPTCDLRPGDGNGNTNTCSSAFVVKMASNGGIAWSTYFRGTSPGGAGSVSGVGVTLDESSNVYVLAIANDGSLPTKNTILGSQNDGFLFELSPDASTLLMGTYLGLGGGTPPLNINSLNLDSNLNAYFSGSAPCGGYGCQTIPATPGAFQTSSAGGSSDGYVLKVQTQQQPSATALAISPSGTLTTAQTVALTANVTTSSTLSGSAVPTGTVNFLDGATTIGTGTLNASGVATYSGTLPPGSYSVTAQYGGDSGFNGSNSTATALQVKGTPATLTTPAPGSTLLGPSATFTWSTSTGATGYALWLGSTGVGSYNIRYSSQSTATSLALGSLPTNGETIYARLFTYFGAASVTSDYTYNAVSAAALTSPTPGTALLSPNLTFTWSTPAGATGYALWLGSTGVGSYNLRYASQSTATSAPVSHLPSNGETIYARLITYFGPSAVTADTTFTAVTVAALTSPAPGSSLLSPNVTFTWSSPAGATGYALWLGTTGAGSYNLRYASQSTATSAGVGHLPTNGETIYARLFTYFGSSPVTTDYTFNAVTASTLTSPTNGSTLLSPSVTFTWSNPAGATGYELWLGSTGVGSYNLRYASQSTATSASVAHLPSNGETIYARLTTYFGTAPVTADYTFTAVTASALTSPAPASSLLSPNVTFTWSSPAAATGYALWLGSTGVGSYDLHYASQSTATSAAVGHLPTNGGTIYARLFTYYGTAYVTTDYTYTAVTAAAISSPAPSTTLSGSTATFTWSSPAGATGYALWLGSSGAGSYDIRYASESTATSATVNGLPTNGETIYARLITYFGSAPVSTDYTYTAK